VSQISPPVRILLVGAIVFLAAWFTVLRPKSASTAAPAATPVATATGTPTDGLGRAVAKARGAAATAETAAKAAAGESTAKTQPQAQTGTATKSPQVREVKAVAIPDNVLAKLPHDVSRALNAQDTIVLGVIADRATELRPLADDDRYVRNALSRVNTYDGAVLVKVVPVSQLVRYAPLVGDLEINQTPSVVVIDHKLRGTVLTGYVDRISINQAIADARANGVRPLIPDPYLRKLSATCTQWTTHQDRWSYPTIPGRKALKSSMDRRVRLETRYRAIFTDLAAPKRWRSLKAEFVAALKSYDASLVRQTKAIKAHDHHAWVTATESFDTGRFRKLDARLDDLGVTGCVSNRRS
jgi:hypothetical protein